MPTSNKPPAIPGTRADRPRGAKPRRRSLRDFLTSPGALRTLFQPIVRHSPERWQLHALECLTRGPAGTDYADASSLFAAARRLHFEALLDRACIVTALETVALHEIEADLFLNVSPVTLATDPGFPGFLAGAAVRCGIAPSRLTIEVIEEGRGEVTPALTRAVRHLHRLGMDVAIDDYGTTAADQCTMESCQCRPDLVKLDGRLFRAARSKRSIRQRVRAIVREAQSRGIQVIAEGVERAADVRLAARLNIGLLQGHHFCRPVPADQAAALAAGMRKREKTA